MARALQLTAGATIAASYTNARDLSTPSDVLSLAFSDEYTTGTSANQSDRLYQVQASVSAASTNSYDLAGSLTDSLGQALTFVKIRGIYIRNRTTTAGLFLEVGGNAAPVSTLFGAAADTLIVGPGGVLLLTSPVDGYAVTATSADVIDIANAGGSAITYDLVIWGTSA